MHAFFNGVTNPFSRPKRDNSLLLSTIQHATSKFYFMDRSSIISKTWFRCSKKDIHDCKLSIILYEHVLYFEFKKIGCKKHRVEIKIWCE